MRLLPLGNLIFLPSSVMASLWGIQDERGKMREERGERREERGERKHVIPPSVCEEWNLYTQL